MSGSLQRSYGIPRFSRLLWIPCLFTPSWSQTISTSTPIPPLQWINLTRSLSGPAAPPLKDASIGYDDNSRNLLIFGGESADGIVQSKTYLLNLDTLTWSTPSPPSTLQNTPPARSAAISGDDFAASNRHGHVVIGGKGSNGTPLSDVWEFDYVSQFWSEVSVSAGGPSARWGAVGGLDTRTSPISDSSVPGPNNTLYVAGGFDGSSPISLSDVWEFSIAGTLSSSTLMPPTGSWKRTPIGKLPSKVNEAGTVLSLQAISYGGCTSSSNSNNSCAQQDSYVLNVANNGDTAPSPCPAPRFSASMVPNMNAFSTSFSSQVFLLLGSFNTSLWDDDDGLNKGEIGILDIDTGTWSRIIPSGDPTSSGSNTPGAREGASVVTYPRQLVGSSRSAASDTLVFGGRDGNGNYLDEVWLLRAYNGSLGGSNQHWSGFGDGQLQSGKDASGAGVTVQYMTSCASQISSPGSPHPSSSGSSTGSSSTPTSSAPSGSSSTVVGLDTSVTHKALAPVSVGLVFIATLLFRFVPLHGSSPGGGFGRTAVLWYVAIVVGIAAYGVGIGGLASAFVSSTQTVTLRRRSQTSSLLRSNHARAGLALFVGLYGLVPVAFAIRMAYVRRHGKDVQGVNDDSSERGATSNVANEKGTNGTTTPTPVHTSPPASPRPRLHSWGPSNYYQNNEYAEEANAEQGPSKSFEVINRPSRTRRASAFGMSLPATHSLQPRATMTSRTLSDVGWMQRRRTINAVSDLDYALTQETRSVHPSTTGQGDLQSTRALMTSPFASPPRRSMPQPLDMGLRLLFHAFLLAVSILALTALWVNDSRAGFAVFLACTVAFYAALIVAAWNDVPTSSALSILLARLRAKPTPEPRAVAPSTPSPRPLSSIGLDQYPFPSDSRSPYVHQPTFRLSAHDELGTTLSPGSPRSVETDEEEDDEDEDATQRRIEEEMGRRDVSIVTVPKRKLWVANPSTS